MKDVNGFIHMHFGDGVIVFSNASMPETTHIKGFYNCD